MHVLTNLKNTCTLQSSMSFFNKKTPAKQKRPTQNTFEQVYELGKDTAQKAVKETIDTLNPLSGLFGGPAQEMRKQGKNDFSDLDVQKLNKAYEQEDQDEIMRLQRIINPEQAQEQDDKKEAMEYHRRVQKDEEEYNLKKQQEKEEEKRQEAMEEQQRKQQEEEERIRASQQENPKGKVRKSILGGAKRKASSELPAEHRPDSGKQ